MLIRRITGPAQRLHHLNKPTSNMQSLKTIHYCLCGQMYVKSNILRVNKPLELLRVKPIRILKLHSTQSDQHRQKVVIETIDTSTPKIVIEKLQPVIPDKSESRLRDKVVEWRQQVDPYINLMRLNKPIGIWLLYWPCTWSIALGAIETGVPLSEVLNKLLLFLTGAVLMRSAGCTINDLWDRDIDARVERTKDRPLVSGAITEKKAIVFLAAQLSAGLAVLLQLNWYSVALGASSMALVITYPLAKRFTNYPQLFLGATFNWGALLGYSAVAGHGALACAPLYLGACAWTVLYDTIYAHQDKIDDARIGIKSTALTFGDNTKPALSAVAAASSALFCTTGVLAGLDWPFYAALLAAGGHAAHQIYTLNPDNPADCAKKFKSNTWIGLLLFLGIVGGGYKQYRETSKQTDKQTTSTNIKTVDTNTG